MIAAIRSYLATSKKLVFAILVLGLLTSVFAVGLMFVAGYLISASANGAFSLLMLNIPLAFVQIFGLGKPITRYFERLKSHDWVLRLTSDLRYRLFRAVQRADRMSDQLKTGDVLGSLANDIEQVQNLYLRVVFPVAISWLTGLLLVIIAGAFSLALFTFFLGMLVVLCVLVPLLALQINKARIVRVDDMRAGLYGAVTDAVMGAQDVAIAGRGSEYTAHFLSRFETIEREGRKIEAHDRGRLLVIQVLLLFFLFVIVWWTTKHYGGNLGGSSDWIVAVALGFFPLIEVFAPISQQFEEALTQRESLARLGKRGVLVDDEEGVSKDRPHHPLDIVFDRVSFSYDDRFAPDQGVLRGVSLSIPAGQKVAILGKSGSGKSTLARLLHGDIDPCLGDVLIGGVASRQLRDSIWEYVGFISQSSYVFAMSIFDNLRIGKPEISESEAWAALDAVGLREHVESLPDQLETIASEAGLNFSGGQRQRLVLARVLLQDPPIIVLDEPTVGLDPVTEQRVLDALLVAFKDKTILMITHHLQGVEGFDRVIFIESGELEMDGAPAELKRSNERYQRLLEFDRGIDL